MKDIGSAGGVVALLVTVWKFFWERGDREEKRLAALVLSCEPITKAVGRVAVDAVTASGDFVMSGIYEEQRTNHEEKLDNVLARVDQMDKYMRSDQLPRAIAAAMRGAPMRRNAARNTDDEQ